MKPMLRRLRLCLIFPTMVLLLGACSAPFEPIEAVDSATKADATRKVSAAIGLTPNALRSCAAWSATDLQPSTCYQALRVDEIGERQLLVDYSATLNSIWPNLVPTTKDEQLALVAALNGCGATLVGTASLATGTFSVIGVALIQYGGADCITKALPLAIRKAYWGSRFLNQWAIWSAQQIRVDRGKLAISKFRASVKSSPVTVAIALTRTGSGATASLSGACPSVAGTPRLPMALSIQSGRSAANFSVSCVSGRWSKAGVLFATYSEYSVVGSVEVARDRYSVSSVIDRGL